MSNEIRYFSDGEQATAEVLNRPTKDLGLKEQYMSKAEFESMAQMRRNAYAGSGFVDWGEDWTNPVNQGISTWNTDWYTNHFAMGNNSGNKKHTPLVNVNGNIIDINHIHPAGGEYNLIKLPAPATSLGTITDSTSLGFDMKQGDFAILDDLNRELVENGTFDTGIDGWSAYNFSIEYDSDNKRIKCVDSGGYSRIYREDAILLKGIKYKVKFDVLNENSNGSAFSVTVYTGKLFYNTYAFSESIEEGVLKSFELELIGEGYPLQLGLENLYTVYFDNISVKQIKETPIVSIQDVQAGIDIYANADNFEARDSISRQDLVFLETWHENVADKDIVYPYGNIQYRGDNTDGLSNIGEGTFAGKETYSLFGNWQSENDLVGFGYKWSELSNEDKLKFAGNKENNIYKDGDNIIQVRYRVRVIKGLGNEWKRVSPQDGTNTYYNGLLGYNGNYLQAVRAKLSLVISPEIDQSGYGSFRPSFWSMIDTEQGIYKVGDHTEPQNIVRLAYDGNGFALPIALVQRRNDGAFDPVYNPEGSGTFTDGKEWYETSDSHNNLTDCFNNKANGYIGTVSGRPDRLFVDEINERDVEDLRMSALKRPYKEILDEYNSKAITGKIRGKEQTQSKIFSFVRTVTNIIDGGNIDITFDKPLNGYDGVNNLSYKIKSIKFSNGIEASGADVGYILSRPDYGNYAQLMKTNYSLSILSDLVPGLMMEVTVIIDERSVVYNNTLTHCDIIGDPRKLSDRVKYTVVDGTSQIVDLLLNDYVLNDDGHIYRALVSRDGIDLDTDDYTNTDNWIDLGTDSSIGGYPQEWLDNGVMGSPLIIGENGESLLPVDGYNGSAFYAKMSRKFNKFLKSIILKKDGTWFLDDAHTNSNSTNAYGWSLDNYSDLGYASEQEMLDLMIVQVYYESFADSFIEDNNSKVLEIANEATIEGDTLHSNNPISIMTQNLIGKVNTSIADQDYGLKFSSLGFEEYIEYKKIDDNYGIPTTIDSVDDLLNFAADEATSSPQVKFFSYLSENNNRLKLQYIFKELKYDETDGWGDDERFQIIDKVSTINDDNGNKVLYGQKSTKLPYFIKD